MSRSCQNPRITTRVKRLLRRRLEAFRVAGRRNNAKNQARYRHLNSVAQREMRKANEDFIDQTVCGELQCNSKRFWSYLKSKRQDSHSVTPFRKSYGVLYNDAASKAVLLDQQFYSVYTREDTTNMPDKDPSPYPDIPAIQVATVGVCKLLKGIKSHWPR